MAWTNPAARAYQGKINNGKHGLPPASVGSGQCDGHKSVCRKAVRALGGVVLLISTLARNGEMDGVACGDTLTGEGQLRSDGAGSYGWFAGCW